MKRLTGAALYARVEREIRAELSEDYGLPMHEYVTTLRDVDDSIGSDMQPTLAFTFERGDRKGRTIQVYGIEPHDDGTVAVRSAAIEFR